MVTLQFFDFTLILIQHEDKTFIHQLRCFDLKMTVFSGQKKRWPIFINLMATKGGRKIIVGGNRPAIMKLTSMIISCATSEQSIRGFYPGSGAEW